MSSVTSKIETIKEYIRTNDSIKVAINEPVGGELKFYKIDLGKGNWYGYTFVNDITISSRRSESIPIKDRNYRELILEHIVDNGIKECIDRYKRESTEYKLSTHPINDERIEHASQDEIEQIFIPFIWERQTEFEQNRRVTREKNFRGFNIPDAGFFSHIVKDKLDRGLHLNATELENVKRRLCRYSEQFSEM